MNNNPDQQQNQKEQIGGLAYQPPPAPETLHKKPMTRKVPPHMRRLNMRFSSPSDNLSPMSQKLMLADRNNASIKTIRPKSLKDVLLQANSESDGRFASCTARSNTDTELSECDDDDLVMDGPDNDNNLLDDDDGIPEPPSPTKSTRSYTGGLVPM